MTLSGTINRTVCWVEGVNFELYYTAEMKQQ